MLLNILIYKLVRSSPVKYAMLVFFEKFHPDGIDFVFHWAGGVNLASTGSGQAPVE
jgi:hypothetical protein